MTGELNQKPSGKTASLCVAASFRENTKLTSLQLFRAVVGANGAGKSTLLKAVVGEIDSDGKIVVGTKETVGYLQQTAVAGSNNTIFDEAASGMTKLVQAKADMEKAMSIGDLDALDRATTIYDAIDGPKQEQKVATVLNGLGFVDTNMRCDELSGGWQMRVAFARLLLSEPSLCLMDEPSNHLDKSAMKWLARYLKNYDGDGSMVLVTHNVDLLKSMDHIAEVIPGPGSLQIYKSCNYDQYLELKAERASSAKSEYARNVEKAAKLQAFVDRFGASATKASAAQSRVKQLEKMEAQGLLDAPAEDVMAQRFKPSLVLSDPPRSIGEVLMELNEASIGYNNEVLVKDVNLQITKGMKLLIRGANGSGKSTCLKSLQGSIPLVRGDRAVNPDVRLGIFKQDLAQELDVTARAVDLVLSNAREGTDGDITVSEEQARSTMGRLGLQGEKPLRRIADLSGGEKARVALAMFATKASNIYLLDEISNHLDEETVIAVGEALNQWDEHGRGAVVVVSHDENLCSHIEFTHVATVRDGHLSLEQRAARASDWVVSSMSEQALPASGNARSDTVAGKKTTQEIDPQLRKKAFNAPKRIGKLEALITQAEEKVAELEEEMLGNGNDVGKLVDLTKEKDAIQLKVTEYMEEWEELETILEMVG